MKKIVFAAVLAIFVSGRSEAQSIARATMGTGGGELRNGNVVLSFTIGEPFVGLRSGGGINLANGFWTVVPAAYHASAITVYRFTGNGVFTGAANWENGLVPPNPLPQGSEIIINPTAAGQCTLNIQYRLSEGSRISVVAGKKFVIAGSLILNKP